MHTPADSFETTGITLTREDILTLDMTSPECLEGYRDIRLAVATPAIRLGDVSHNEQQILAHITEATEAGVDLLLFSDMPLTGKSCGDLIFQKTMQDACLESLARITRATAGSFILVLLSLPLRLEDRLFKATAILHNGEIVGMTPASYLSRDERRWFSDPFEHDLGHHDRFSCELITDAGEENNPFTELRLPPIECPTILRHVIDRPLPAPEDRSDGGEVLEFSLCDMSAQNLLSFTFSFVNLCTVIPCLAVRPSLLPRDMQPCQSLRLFNFDASHATDALSHGSIPVAAIADGRLEWTGEYRRLKRELIRRSLRDHSITLYAGGGLGESASQGVFAGHRLIISDGRVLAEGESFHPGLTIADIAAGELLSVRSNAGNRWDIQKEPQVSGLHGSDPDKLPFLMRSELTPQNFYQETLTIQAKGLADRLALLGAKPILGLSGGLDSSVALLVSLEALRLLDRPPNELIAVFMPGPGTSKASGELAQILAESTGVDYRVIPIDAAVKAQLANIGHDGLTQDITFENAQARERTQILMDLANMEQGIVIGTGDLSELALGWCTYNADQMSMYAVNSTLSKTVIREMTRVASDLFLKNHSPLIEDDSRAKAVGQALRVILERPVSPELLPPDEQDRLLQLTEDSIGPYELVDFFLWHLIFHGQAVGDVYELALKAFGDEYSADDIRRWLSVFIGRFFRNQFKRTASPEGVSAFPWRLTPYSAWQMPGDATGELWIRALEAHIASRKETL